MLFMKDSLFSFYRCNSSGTLLITSLASRRWSSFVGLIAFFGDDIIGFELKGINLDRHSFGRSVCLSLFVVAGGRRGRDWETGEEWQSKKRRPWTLSKS
jgi:hypothetical protein